MANACGYDVGVDCVEKLNELPVAQGDSYVDGNSYGCRALHATFAATNPEAHCPHISFEPLPDLDDKIKCQGSGQVLAIESLFEQEDLDFFDEVLIKNGFTDAGYEELPL
mmetsp:Transcript_9372/g.14550  ORF Transcript_9372/g.14550 Transcript_9372/m.14550 type:complete len:110 (+) Transcript_9372:589-918(+)